MAKQNLDEVPAYDATQDVGEVPAYDPAQDVSDEAVKKKDSAFSTPSPFMQENGGQKSEVSGYQDPNMAAPSPLVNGRSTSDLLKNQIKDKSNQIIQQRTQEQFTNNPLFQETNPNSERNRQVFLEHTKQTLPKSQFEDQWGPLQPIADLADKLGGNVIEGTKEGVKKAIVGQAMVASAKDFKTAAQGELKKAIGAGEAGFAAAGAISPHLAAFNTGIELLGRMPESAKAKAIDAIDTFVVPLHETSTKPPTEKEKAEKFDNLVSLPFTLASTTAKALGYEPKPETWQADVLEATDLIIPLIAGKVAAEKTIKSINDVQDISKKVAEGKATPEEARDLSNVSEEFQKLTAEDIKAEAEKQRAKAVEQAQQRDAEIIQVQAQREKLGVPPESPHVEIPENVGAVIGKLEQNKLVGEENLTAASDHLYAEYKRLQAMKADPNRAFTTEQINEAMGEIDNAITEIESRKEYESNLSPELQRLHKRQEDLDRAEVSEVLRPNIEQLKVENEAAIKAEQDKQKDQVVSNAVNTVNEIQKAEDLKTAEADLAKNVDNPVVAEIAQQKITELQPPTSEALKDGEPLKTEANVEKINQPESVQGERENGSEIRKTGETSSSNSLLSETPGNEEKINQGVAGETPAALTGVKNEATQKIIEDLGLEQPVKSEGKTHEQLDVAAEEMLRTNPKEVEKIITRLEKNEIPNTDFHQRLVGKYIAAIKAKIDAAPTNELISEMQRAVNLAQTTLSSDPARSLSARQGLFEVKDSLGDWLVQTKEALNVDALTDAEIGEVKKQYEKFTEAEKEAVTAKEVFDEKVYGEKAQAEINKLKKEIEDLKKGKTSYKAKAKSVADKFRDKYKTKELPITLKDKFGNDVIVEEGTTANGISKNDLIELIAQTIERSGRIADAVVNFTEAVKEKEWYKNLSKESKESLHSQVEGIMSEMDKDAYNELLETAKDKFPKGLDETNAKYVKDLVRKKVESGTTDLKILTKDIGAELGLPEADVRDAIAGKYNKKATRSDIINNLKDLSDEAKLLGELESLQRGEIAGKKEFTVRDRQRIKELQEQIKGYKDELGITDKDRLIRAKRRNKLETKNFKEKLEKGDFSKEKTVGVLQDLAIAKKFPKEREAALDAMRKKREAKHDFEVGKIEAELAQRSKNKKFYDDASKTLNTVGKLKATLDFSAMGVHNGLLAMMRPKMWKDVYGKSIKEAFSEKKFKQEIEAIRSNEEVSDMIDLSGLDILDLDAMKDSEREQLQLKTWFDKHKTKSGKEIHIGKHTGLDFFDRAFISMGNNARLNLFLTEAARLQEQGKTVYTHPELYKGLATYVNNLTGRGKIHPTLQGEIVNKSIWAPRLLASRLNTLGIGDITSKKGFYRALPKEIRQTAYKDIGRAVGYGTALMLAASLGGADVDGNPESVTFGQIKFPNGVSFNPFSQLTSVVRLFVNMARGRVVKNGKPEDKPWDKTALHFLRGKLAPIPGIALDLGLDKTYGGETPSEDYGAYALKSLTPMSVNGIVKEVKNEGPVSLLTEAPLLFSGFNFSNEKDYPAKSKVEQKLEKRRKELNLTPEERIQKQRDEIQKGLDELRNK